MTTQSLSEWSRQNNVPYHKAWRQFSQGKIKDAYKTEHGNILVESQPPPSLNNTSLGEPLAVAFSETIASHRRNETTTIIPTDRFANIESGISPFHTGSSQLNNNSNINIREAIGLCQLTWYNFSIFRMVIELMVEFSVSKVYFSGGTKKSRDFFTALFKKINITSIQERFFRELFRSSNVFIYPFYGKIQEEDVAKITQVYGAASTSLELPVKYIILNPHDIEVSGSSSFISPTYYKVMTAYEVEALRNPRTEEDQQIYDGLSNELKNQVKESKTQSLLMPLDMSKVYYVPYKKQDYEAMAVPMGYPVLEDINFKAELRKVDLQISRTVNQCILLITMGYESKEGAYQYSQKTAEAIQKIFESGSVGKVLIGDFTLKGEFLIPDIANLLDPKKYEAIDRDIQNGLNNILMASGDNSKFANKSFSIKLFIERLKSSREIFLNEFLIPEIKKISKQLSFKVYPTPHFADIDLKDETEYARMVTQLATIGWMTPEETFTAIEDGRLPTAEESEESQVKFLDLKEKGFYQPIAGGTYAQMQQTKEAGKQEMKVMDVQHEHDMKSQRSKQSHEAANPPPKPPQAINFNMGGRPAGTKSPKKKQKVSPVGKASFSASKIKETVMSASKLESEIENLLREQGKIAKGEKLNDTQTGIVSDLTALILTNEPRENWSNKQIIGKYIINPVDTNSQRVEEMQEIAYEHALGVYESSILLNSRVD